MGNHFYDRVESAVGRDQINIDGATFDQRQYHAHIVATRSGGKTCPVDASPPGCGGELRKTSMVWMQSTAGVSITSNMALLTAPPKKNHTRNPGPVGDPPKDEWPPVALLLACVLIALAVSGLIAFVVPPLHWLIGLPVAAAACWFGYYWHEEEESFVFAALGALVAMSAVQLTFSVPPLAITAISTIVATSIFIWSFHEAFEADLLRFNYRTRVAREYQEEQRLQRIWDNSWTCLACGNKWYPPGL